MQSPTCTGLRIRSVRDAEIVLHAVSLNMLPMVTRRLDDDERLALVSGCIYVWEERSSSPLEATGQEIQRFTEGRSWGPSRARDDFLLYYEKESASRSSLMLRNNLSGSSQLIKQTYSVFVHITDQPTRKWHLNAYYTQDTVDQLRTVDHIPTLRDLEVPAGRFVCARTSGSRRANRGAGRATSATHKVSAASLSSQSERSTTVSPKSDERTETSVPRMNPTIHYLPLTLSTAQSAHRRLAPLEFLQSIPPKVRDPIDDQALKSFCSKI
ncbi:hypothetical protein WOLCODRAFT_166611 [Wolfiporia cocos MD-104 SS10]|uniref:cAMP-independent regulatory protein pac2 n=1 Tax=Wolfiporia cocos (strain MD-104) TaxID=742152 RepID=A0A2H3J193_WOLCO|nr:hypothetical protein WOLCODRAFT_166611 [Wolfiporia cocos MD-104 SS10]